MTGAALLFSREQSVMRDREDDFRDGINYVPEQEFIPVVGGTDFVYAAVCCDHGHINGMCSGLAMAGAVLKWVYEPDPRKRRKLMDRNPQARVAKSLEQILEDPEVRLVACAAVPDKRWEIGVRVMKAGKDFFTDKPAFTTMEQLAAVKQAARDTGRKYMIYYSEHLHCEASIFAGELIRRNAIGKVLQVIGMGPHRLDALKRPDWFFQKKHNGGILCDIGSQQIEDFMHYTGCHDARIEMAHAANLGHPDYPELEDFGEAVLTADNGARLYLTVNWFTPAGLSAWGDGRTFILGTEGTIELRKYINVGEGGQPANHVFLVNGEGEYHYQVTGQVGFPFFSRLIRDCLNRTENAMTQEHAFKAAELAIAAERLSERAGSTAGGMVTEQE